MSLRERLEEEGMDARNVVSWRVPNSPRESVTVEESHSNKSDKRKSPDRNKTSNSNGIFNDSQYSNRSTSKVNDNSVGKTNPSKYNQDESNDDGTDSNSGRYSFQNKLWKVLFANVNRSIDEIYRLCEEEEDESRCQETMEILERSYRDFVKLIDRITEQRRFDQGDLSGVSWEVRKPSSTYRITQTMEAENPEMFQRFTHSRLRFAEKQEAIAASQPQKTTVLRATAKPFEPSRPLIDTTTFANAANINSKDTKNNNVVLSNKENTKNSVPMDTTKSDKINSKVQINNKSNTIAMISQTVHMPKTKARSDTMTSESSRNSGNNTGKWTEAPKISKEFPNIPHSFRNSEDKRNNSRSSTVGGGLDYTNPNTNNIGIYHVADKKVIEVDEDTQAQVARETEQVWAAVEGWVEAEAVAEEKAWQKFLGTYKNDKRNKYTANNKRNRNFHYSIDYRGNRGLSKDSLTEDAEVADQLLADVLKTSLPLSPTSEQKTDLLIDTSPIVSKDPFSLSEMEFTCDSIASSFITDVSRSGQKTEYDWSSLAEGSRATGLHSLEQDSYNYMRSSLSKGVYSSHNSPTTRRHTYNDSVATSSTSNAYSPVSHAAGILSVSSCSYSSPPFGTRSLHDKLSSPDRKRALSPNAALKIIEARQTAAENNRENYVAEKIQKAMIASTRVKLRVEKEAIRIAKAEQALAWKLKEAEARHNEYIKMIKGKAGNENAKVDEITFINTLNSESIAEQLQKKLEDVEARILAAGERRKQRLLGISVQQRKKNTKKAQQMSELRLAHEQQKMERWEKLQKRLKSVQERREARLAELSRRFDEETRGRSSSNALNKSADSEDLLPPSHDNSKTVSSKVVKRIHDGGIAAVSLSDSNSEIAGVKNSAETLRDVASTEAALSELQSKLKTKKSKKKKNKSKEISTEFLNVLDAIDTVGELNRNELEARMIANESKYSSTVRISNNTNFDSTSVRYPVISEAVVDAEFQKLHNMIKRKTVVNALNDISQALDTTGASVPSRVNATGDSNVKIIASLICKMTSVSTICSTIRAFTAAALSAARDYNDLQECDQLISELSSQMKIEDISNDISSDKMNAYKLIWTQLPEVLDSFSFDSVDQVDDSTAEDLVVLIRICFGYEIGLMSAPTMAFLAINNKTYLDYVEKLLNYILLIQKKFNEKLIVAGLPIVLVDLFSLLLSIYNTTIRNDRDNYHDKIVYSFSLEKTFGGLLQAVAKIIGTFVTELSTTSTIKSSKENDNEAEISTRINSNYIDNFIWYLFCMDHFNTVTETIFIQSQLLESLNHQYNTKNVEEADAFNNPTVDYLVDYRISIFSTISYTTSALLGFTNSIAYYIRSNSESDEIVSTTSQLSTHKYRNNKAKSMVVLIKKSQFVIALCDLVYSLRDIELKFSTVYQSCQNKISQPQNGIAKYQPYQLSFAIVEQLLSIAEALYIFTTVNYTFLQHFDEQQQVKWIDTISFMVEVGSIGVSNRQDWIRNHTDDAINFQELKTRMENFLVHVLSILGYSCLRNDTMQKVVATKKTYHLLLPSDGCRTLDQYSLLLFICHLPGRLYRDKRFKNYVIPVLIMMSLDVDMNLILIKTESKISNVINYLKVIINEIGRANSKDSSAIESGVSIEKLSAVSRLLPVDLWHIALLAVGGDLQDS